MRLFIFFKYKCKKILILILILILIFNLLFFGFEFGWTAKIILNRISIRGLFFFELLNQIPLKK